MLTISKTYVTSFFSTNANLHEILEVKKCARRGWMLTQDRQSVGKAREAWQKVTGKEASDLTFKRFLSALAAVGETLEIKLKHNAA